mgnify:CR=1 FL=1
MIFAGEASGDLQGALLADEIRRICPSVKISGSGGIKMKEAGIELLLDTTTLGVIGLWEGIKKSPLIISEYLKFKKEFIRRHPDLVIFIDAPASNMRLAKIARRMGIKSVYFFPPSAWSASLKRARKVGASVDLVVNAFQFTSDTYEVAGVKNTFYTGHPLIDYMQKWKNADKTELKKELGLKREKRYISLLPGSRVQEIEQILPLMIESANMLLKQEKDIWFLIPVASPALKNLIKDKLKYKELPLTLLDGKSQAAMAVSELVILASGSAALEAGILEVPMIITYRLNELDYRIIRKFIKLRWAGLPNLILKREVVPELLQDKATVNNICRIASELLADSEKRREMLSGLKELNYVLGEPGVIKRIVAKIWDTVL